MSDGAINKRAVIFDMYGVIMRHPRAGLMDFVGRRFPRYGEEDVYPAWLRAACGEMGSHEFFAALGYDGDLAALEREYLDGLELDGGFFACAEALRARGWALALLSNDIAGWNAYLRRRHRLEGWFDAVVVSGDAGCKKPEPEIYHLVLEELGLPAGACVFVDDRPGNLRAAAALGMRPVHFYKGGPLCEAERVEDFAALAALLE